PNQPIDAASAEAQRVVKRGRLRGLDIANSLDMKPLWDPVWNPLWEDVSASGLPLHFHTVGGRQPEPVRRTLFPGLADPARYQADRIGVMAIDDLATDPVMWGSHFPVPGGVWPDSREYIRR